MSPSARIAFPLKVLGTGRALPDRVMTNADLERMVDTSDEWISDRTGIKERRVAAEGVATSDLAAEALKHACESAALPLADLDAIVVATSTPDTLFPSTACWLQERLGVHGMPAFDVSAGCSGFLFALELAAGMLAARPGQRIGIVGAEVMSRVVDWSDRHTCVLFGDGAGAFVVGAGDGSTGVCGSQWGSDGRRAKMLYMPAGGSQRPASHATVDAMQHVVHMDGPGVFKNAVTAMSKAAIGALAAADISIDEVDLLIPHQANLRIMEACRERTGIPRERMYSVLHRYGNMSAASVPVAVHDALQEGRIKDGDTLLMTAFGTGFTWAASVLRW